MSNLSRLKRFHNHVTSVNKQMYISLKDCSEEEHNVVPTKTFSIAYYTIFLPTKSYIYITRDLPDIYKICVQKHSREGNRSN